MLCQNCGENEANVRYTQIVNGVKKEMALCDKCASKLGIGKMDFNMPISFSSFLGDFFDDEKELLPDFVEPEKLICDKCGMTYDDFVNTGKFGCDNCYEVFSKKIDPILKNIHGGNRHIGRGLLNANSKKEENNKTDVKPTYEQKDNELEQLNNNLKQAIQEERYEDAAKLRDKIKEIENRKNK